MLRTVLVAAVLACGGCSRRSQDSQQHGDSASQGVEAAKTAEEAAVRERIAAVEKLAAEGRDRGAVLYYIAAMKLHLGEKDEALRLLKECVSLGEGFDPAASPLFKTLVESSAEFGALTESMHRGFPRVERAGLAFVTRERDLVPEGVAYDSRRGVFYLSSLNRRKIVTITAQRAEWDFVPAGRDDLMPVLGIRVNNEDGTVWANSWSEDTDRSELLHFDGSGKLLGRYAPADEAKHGFNDLVVRKNGEVILTDSVSNEVLRFDPKAHAFAVLRLYRRLFEPNGIALSGDERELFVGDDLGMVRVDLESGENTDLEPGPHNTLAGADGLYWHKGGLIAIQNAIGSPRIAAFRLPSDGRRVVETTVLESRTAFMEEPTTGAIRGDDFYFIVNSQGGNMNGDAVADATKLEPVKIGVLRLP